MSNPWPPLPYADSRPTLETLQLMAQVVGKVRLALSPWLNHSWHAPLYVSARGLATGIVHHRQGPLDLEFDLVAGRLLLRGGGDGEIRLQPTTVAAFYAEVMATLAAIGRPTTIHAAPNELPEAMPFAEDRVPRAFDPGAAERFWRALVQSHRVLSLFRTGFLGKSSPVHFFWGSFDLAATRFSGRKAPPHPGGVPNLPDAVVREAYSHEVSSAGFWPGGGVIDYPAFYAYAYPEPDGFRTASPGPAAAFFSEDLGEFILPYDAVRTAPDPDAVLLAFLQATYAAAADNGGWDRPALECGLGRPGVPRPV